jgi:Domain of unknown function (DUF4410)
VIATIRLAPFKKSVCHAAILSVLLAVAGCASSSALIKNASPISTDAPVSLDFVLVETSSSLTNLKSETKSLDDLIITGLRETQIFDNVSGNKADALSASGMKVSADIGEISKVSPDARVWLGGLAGRARILVRVTVSNLNSAHQIQTFEVEGLSGDTARAGTTNEAIQMAARRIVAELVKITRQTSQ